MTEERSYPGRKRGRKPSILTPLAQDFEKAKARFERAVKARDTAVQRLQEREEALARETIALNDAAGAFQEALNSINAGGSSLPEGYDE